MVAHKIAPVDDLLCQDCAQCWEGECRIFELAHSEAEQTQRKSDPQGLCQISVLRWTYDINHPERLRRDIAS